MTYIDTPSSTGIAERDFINRTYSWMTAGLGLTAGVAYITSTNIALMQAVSGFAFLLMLVQIGLVMGISFLAERVDSTTASILFLVYAFVTGLVFALILGAYSPTAVASAFFTTAGTFGAMSFIGYNTKKDLTTMGRFAMFALIGLVIATIVNIFVASSMLNFIISVVGVVLFAGLTAYDTQKLKEMARAGLTGQEAEKGAIFGALALYLDFINMFLFILRLMGGSRD